ncbi:hypothetical protein JSY36_03305 [Bacillus sp. H-16]|uniref:hypothetical protein n=1 Tax=Alteribacter salitolerans TaxID=2912333 RepID=UPI00196608FA|nr:hypothetical protein [Alteribacter salitolerans]MBM7094775.1 hypothetical protein [Alteribacter salitolerans]
MSGRINEICGRKKRIIGRIKDVFGRIIVVFGRIVTRDGCGDGKNGDDYWRAVSLLEREAVFLLCSALRGELIGVRGE